MIAILQGRFHKRPSFMKNEYEKNLKFSKFVFKQIALFHSVAINKLFVKFQNRKSKLEIPEEFIVDETYQEEDDQEKVKQQSYLKKLGVHQQELYLSVKAMKSIDYLLAEESS